MEGEENKNQEWEKQNTNEENNTFLNLYFAHVEYVTIDNSFEILKLDPHHVAMLLELDLSC